MKQYFIGFIIGACLIASVASAVMFMGAGESNSKIGKYQGFGDTHGGKYIIDTETGQLWFYNENEWHLVTNTFIKEKK